ncbi:MAG: hypothetical protein HY920_04095 [Elusimicrobia bacterium]|nr:hypothetical protein [Elusimicrobiota bacterium]
MPEETFMPVAVSIGTTTGLATGILSETFGSGSIGAFGSGLAATGVLAVFFAGGSEAVLCIFFVFNTEFGAGWAGVVILFALFSEVYGELS